MRTVGFDILNTLKVTIRVRDGKKTTHEGIKVEFIGSIGVPHASTVIPNLNLIDHISELFYDRGHHHEFLSLSQELAAPGEMRQAQTFDFNFKNVEKQFESYQGINVKLRYVFLCFGLLRWTISFSTFKVFGTGDNIQTNARRSARKGHLGSFVPNASR